MSQKEQKDLIRKEMLEKRLTLPSEKANSLSLMIQERLVKSSLWKGKERIGLYSSAKHEVETHLLFMKALEEGASVYFPRVEQGLHYYEVKEPADLAKGAWGIPEPKHHCLPLLESQTLDLVVVPGLAFDKKGYRLGFGKGFYDSILEKLFSQSVGLAYDFQVVEALPVDSWDRRIKRLITEKTEYQF